jgi:hypothetical protein
MDISIFLAQALGIYLLIVSISMVFDAARVKPLILDILNNPPLLFLSGFIALIVGIALVVSHNIWVFDWRVIITLMAWSALIKGAIRVVFPQLMIETSRKWIQSNAAYYITGIALIGVGIFLCYHGFMP